MRSFKTSTLTRLFIGVSAIAIVGAPGIAAAQDAGNASTAPAAAADTQDPSSIADSSTQGDIVVTGIRASLQASREIKRNAIGVVDAISAEEMGKFPDTNLAESLQRITGVSIDRSNGEGSFVTVRGFGPEFNLVTLNGRQMPTSSLGDGASPPSSRAFDFANLASEGVAAVEVYKTGRASIESGGIGASINIRTPRPLDRPGMRGALSVKGVMDTSRNDGNPITPEVSGIFSDTFADDRIGILVTGSYQKRLASVNQANVGWHDGLLGSDTTSGGRLPAPGDPNYANITNPPKATDVYETPQSASYDLNDINRERINGQLVLQFRPIDSLTATVDYTYSRNTVEIRNSNVGTYYSNNVTTSTWTDGPAAGPLFYGEQFTQAAGKDLAYSGALTANRSENKSLGFNLNWKAPGGVTIELDGHHSTAESKPSNKYGSNVSVGTALFGVQSQGIDFRNDLPIISYQMYPGIDPLNAALIIPTGNAFRNAYFKDEINQVQLRGHYDHDGPILDSIDFGASYVDNKVRSAYGYIQNDTWGGVTGGTPADFPDDLFTLVSLPDKFQGIGGGGNPAMIQKFYKFDFERLVGLLNDPKYAICKNAAVAGTCLASYTVDRRTQEKTLAPYLQVNTSFDVGSHKAHLIAGVRYETTTVDSAALVPVPVGTKWVSQNEFDLIYSDNTEFTRFKGSYENWLPSVDFDIEPISNVKLRASYSHTITRADYASLQGGRTLDTLFRIDNGTGSQGNPGLIPYKSKNIDVSAEFYYGKDSYISVGYFRKNVSNFISQSRVDTPAFGMTNPGSGPRYRAAIAALGANADRGAIRDYIFTNYPDSTVRTGGNDASGHINGDILGLPEDDPLTFQIATPSNSNQSAKLYGFEFAVQHSFWNTGFGTILNYTIVNGDAKYHNDRPASASVTQFALTGLSNSANAVLFYDKHGLQARVAYNWRDKFLSQSGPNPTYVAAFGQIDASASYEFIKGFTVFAEGINLNSADRRAFRRTEHTVVYASPGAPRYAAGFRFAF